MLIPLERNRLGVAAGECRQMRDKLWRLGRGKVKSEHADVDRDSLDTVRPSDQGAGLLIDGFHNADD